MFKNRKSTKQIMAVLLSASLAVTGSVPVMASNLNKAKAEKKQAEENLDSVNGQIQDIQDQQSSLQSEIDALDADLVTTIANISMLEDAIVEKQAELDQANSDLAAAKVTEAEQYTSMKERISYMYVNGGEISFFNALLGANSFADVLNQIEMFASVYGYDRDLLTAYQETEAEIADLVAQIAEEEADMQEQQSDLQSQKASLDTMVAQKSSEMSDFDQKLAAAQALASEYKATITKQSEVIAKAVEEQQKAEAAAKAAEEASNKTSSTSESKTVASSSSGSNSSKGSSSSSSSSNSTSTKGDSSSSGSSSSKDNSSSGNGSNSSSGSSSSSSSNSSSSSSSTASGSGQAVADYACQFVGNPYVWGGESLTGGADCSGFIKAVYAHFGVSLPHSSYSLRSVGTAVSPSQMQAGDIVCYDGHVALYIGGGRIVHASNSKTGIIISSNYAYRKVVAIRRIF